MADKSFGVKQLDILGTGESTISAPDRLKLDSHNVAISTSLHVGAATTIGGDLNVLGVSTFAAGGFVDIRRNVSITGIATIAAPYNTNAQVAWTVTNNSASAYRFTGPGQSGSDDNPDLYLVRGQRYIFKHEATSSHPLEIRVANGGAAYNDGVTNNGQHSTNITFNVQHDAPAQLFYQCTSHGGMVGNIYIVGGPQVISGVVTATTFVGNLTGTASANAVLTGSTNNQLVTVTGANAITGESALTFDGSDLTQTISASNKGIKLTAAGSHYPSIIFDSNRASENQGIMWLDGKWNGTSVGAISVEAGDDTTNKDDGKITFYTTQGGTQTRKMAIEQDGDVHIDDGNLVLASGHGIDFSATGNSSGTMQSELLDDYEEGLFTPTITSGGSSITYTIARGCYTKIGDVVNFQIDLYISGTPDGNNLRIGGLPFTTANQATKAFGGAFLNYSNAAFGSIGDRTLFHLVSQNTYMQIYNAVTGNVVAGNSTGVALFSNKEICLTGLYKAS